VVPASGSVFVDSAELERLRQAIRSLHEELTSLAAAVPSEADESALGGWDVGSAVRDFADSWQGAREALAQNLGAAVEFLRFAIDTYEGTELDLAGATEQGA